MADRHPDKKRRTKNRIAKNREQLELENRKLKDEVSKLREELSELSSIHESTVGELNALHEFIKGARHRKYVTNSDKVNYEQLSIFNEAEFLADPEVSEPELPEKQEEQTRRKARKGKRPSGIKKIGIRESERIIDVSDGVKEKYGDRLTLVSSNTRTVLYYHPAYYERVSYIQRIYHVKDEYTETGADLFVRGEMPAMPLGKSYASPSLLSKVITDKFDKGIPFTRQERICLEQGVPLSKQVMSNWMIQLNDRYFERIAGHIHGRIVAGSHVVVDETRVQVLHEEGKTPESESWMWSVMTGRSEPDQMIYFMYAPDRRHHNAQVIMEGFSGTAVADALSAYDKVDGVVHANDWAHARRKFVDTINSAPKGTDMSDSLAARILVLINALFRYDRALRPESMSYDEIASARDRKQRPVVDEIFAKLKKYQDRIPSSTQLYKAVMYALNHEEGLRRYLDDGRIEITSNIIEREMKSFGIARKNFLFMNTVRGAQASANIFSVLRTAVMNGLDPEKYMTYLLERLPLIDIESEKQIDELMPWSGSLPEGLKSKRK